MLVKKLIHKLPLHCPADIALWRIRTPSLCTAKLEGVVFSCKSLGLEGDNTGDFLIDARQAIGADRSPSRLLINVLVMHAAFSLTRDKAMSIKIQAPSSKNALPQLSHEVSAQSLLRPPTLVPDYWSSFDDKRTMEGNKDACRAVSRHEFSRYTQNGRRRIKLKLALCASFHFILEISWARWGS